MAYQTRQRDPLLDSHMQAALQRRGQEVIGLALLALALALALILFSYSPDDPNWMAATDAVPANMLGRFGASVAALLMLIMGYGAFFLPLAAMIWGLRFVLHRGSDRVLTRAIFVPIAAALASIYAASHLPSEGWTHSFGLGGLFGDTILGALLNLLPVASAVMLKLVAAAAFVGFFVIALFVLGVNRMEFRWALRFLLLGLVTTGAMVASGMRNVGSGAGQAAHGLRERRVARQTATRHDDDEPVLRAAPSVAQKMRGPGLLARVPLLGRRDAAAQLRPELPTRDTGSLDQINRPDDDRIRERIADVIKNRVRAPLTASPLSAAVSRAQQAPRMGDRVEPPLRAASPSAHVGATTVPQQTVAPTLPQTELQRRVVQHATKKATQPSRQAIAEAQPSLPLQPKPHVPEYEFPPLTLLTNPSSIQRHHLSDESLEQNARMLENVLDDYGVKGEIVSVRPGPVVTMYELEPSPGLKASRVIGLADDIARSMSALSARVSTVPGRTVIGIELPNEHREKVVLREILASREFGDGNHKLPLALGKDIGGDPIVVNLAKMPHLLIAGTTGSGKSVAINTMILSLLYKLSPEECRMIMIDPKMLELSVYDGIPHLLSPVVTDPKKAVVALKWTVGEMEERYRKMSKMGVRNIDGYNSRVADALAKGEMFSRTYQTGFDDDTGEPTFETEEFAPEKMPFIVVIVDEMADLMMVAGKEIEACIQRLAQMARASGIHIIMATQRPSVDVITGTIKANFPTRISFHVTSKIDSRTILGEMGAEQLLGMGDMLYMAGGAKITRVHGPFVSDEEVEEIVRHLKSFGPPAYAASVLDGPDDDKESDIDLVLGLGGNTDGEDALYDQAVAIVVKDRKCSTSYIQRKLGIGYNKAARLVEQMEENSLVSSANHVGKREILVPEQA